jgi:hypothetical protein
MPLYEPKKGSPGYGAFNKIMKNEKDYPDNYDRYLSAIEADNRALRKAKAAKKKVAVKKTAVANRKNVVAKKRASASKVARKRPVAKKQVVRRRK